MSRPYLSVVIPAYNEAAWLAACLQSLRDQTGAPDYEIIVVDNASTDATAAIAEKQHVRVVRETRRGVCYARQAGLQAARGDIVISTDADCTFPTDWLARIADVFQKQPDVALLCGNYRFNQGPSYANKLLASWEGLVLRLNYAFNRYLYVSAANLAFRKALFAGYNTTLTQGGDELYVLRQLGRQGRVLYRFNRPVLTSPRRLQQGFGRVLFRDFLRDYLWNYWRTLRTGKNKAGSYESHRTSTLRQSLDGSLLAAGLVCVLVLLGLAAGLVLILSSSGDPFINWIGFSALTAGVCSYAAFYPSSQLFGPQPYKVPTPRRAVALTFDDGPNSPFTEEIAATVQHYGGRASFFCVGENARRDPSVVKQLQAAGHLVGAHSWSHQFWHSWRPALLSQEFQQTAQLMQEITGETVRYGRLPWLFRTPRLVSLLQQHDLLPVAGRFVSLAEMNQRDGDKWARKAFKRVRPGSILILHDGYNNKGANRAETVRAAELLCRLLTDNGYELVRIDELL